MPELNPDHPVTKEMREQWHKVIGVLLNEQGLREFEITIPMVKRFAEMFGDDKPCVVADERGGKFVVRLVSMTEGAKLVDSEKKAGRG